MKKERELYPLRSAFFSAEAPGSFKKDGVPFDTKSVLHRAKWGKACYGVSRGLFRSRSRRGEVELNRLYESRHGYVADSTIW